jgi:8-oxo-dGTP diphosphatase
LKKEGHLTGGTYLRITKNNGFEFLDFLEVKETSIYDYHLLAGSYAVIKCDGKYLLCYNTLRKQWELPAGRREENETPKVCAIRAIRRNWSKRFGVRI